MLTIKLTAISMMAMIIGASAHAPIKAEYIHSPVLYPVSRIEMVKSVEQTDLIKNIEPRIFINQDKTTAQCMMEASGRIYKNVNLALKEAPIRAMELSQPEIPA